MFSKAHKTKEGVCVIGMGRENVWPENWDVVLALSVPGDKACCRVLALLQRIPCPEANAPSPSLLALSSSKRVSMSLFPGPRGENTQWPKFLVPLRTGPRWTARGEGKEKRKLLARSDGTQTKDCPEGLLSLPPLWISSLPPLFSLLSLFPSPSSPLFPLMTN